MGINGFLGSSFFTGLVVLVVFDMIVCLAFPASDGREQVKKMFSQMSLCFFIGTVNSRLYLIHLDLSHSTKNHLLTK